LPSLLSVTTRTNSKKPNVDCSTKPNPDDCRQALSKVKPLQIPFQSVWVNTLHSLWYTHITGGVCDDFFIPLAIAGETKQESDYRSALEGVSVRMQIWFLNEAYGNRSDYNYAAFYTNRQRSILQPSTTLKFVT